MMAAHFDFDLRFFIALQTLNKFKSKDDYKNKRLVVRTNKVSQEFNMDGFAFEDKTVFEKVFYILWQRNKSLSQLFCLGR